jgi:hypothetical protein
LLTDNEEIEVAAGDLRLDVGIKIDGTLPNEVPPEVPGMDSEAPETEDEDDPVRLCIADVGGIEDSEAEFFDEASNDVAKVMDNEEDPKVVPIGVNSGLEGGGATVNDVGPALGTALTMMLESGGLDDNVAVTMIVWLELVRVDVVVLPLARTLVSGSGSDIVNCVFDDLAVEPVPVAGISPVLRDAGEVGTDAVVPIIEEAVLVVVVS